MKIYEDTYTIKSYSRSEIFSTSDDDTEISSKWKTRWRTGKREFVNIMKSPFISAIQLI